MPQPQLSATNPIPSLSGKTIMVTGSSSGIGRAIALELASRGAQILLHGRAPSDRLSAVQMEIESLGRSTTAVYCDFAERDAKNGLQEFVNTAWRIHEGIDSWINNAGGDVLTGDWPSRSMDEKLDYLWRVDVSATLMLSRAVGEKMVQKAEESPPEFGGRAAIINMGWDQAEHGMGGESGELFATTKGAIMAMSRSLAQSLAPAVRVNCLAPGWIQTEWGENASDYWSERAKRESLMKRWGTPLDIAHAAAFLCSDEASFISGQILPINGGFRFS